MQLYLGEGAREHLALIRHAVRIWNDALPGKVIELREEPVSYPVGAGRPDTIAGAGYYNDGVSVIYFIDEFEKLGKGGYVVLRQNFRNGRSYENVEADIFVSAPLYPSVYFSVAATTAHEIGHGLGLGHIAVSGNLMSYDRSRGVIDPLGPFSMLNLFPEPYGPGPWQPAWWAHLLGEDPNYRDLAFKSILPGTQDKLALSCLYSEWTGE